MIESIENLKTESTEKTSKIRMHFRENKKVYIGTACGVVVGVVAYAIGGPKSIQIVDNFNLKYKSPTSTQVIAMLERRGHPGNVIRCVETGEPFASQNRAAAATGVNAGALSQHLSGLKESVKGLHFVKEGEATVGVV